MKLANTAEGVDVGYMRDSKLRRVKAKAAIHAGYNMMLPYIAGRAERAASLGAGGRM